jgi:glycosyltransferase involved in cell wall biosynthesis
VQEDRQPAAASEEQAMTQSKSQKKRILYVQLSSGVGGGIINGLYPIVACLNRDRYEPLVLFYWPNPYRERFEALGVKTIVFEKPRSRQHPAPVAQLQKNRLVKNLQRDNGRVNALYHALGSYVRLSYCVPQTLELVKLIKAHDIDLVHLNSSNVGHGREVVLAAKLAGLPCICHVRNFSEFQAADRLIARFVDQYIYCSNAIGQHCVTQGVTPTKGCIIRNGLIDVEKWSQPYDTAQMRREIGWSNKDFIVGNIGRLVPWKGQDIFLKALAEVKREVPGIKGLVVGGVTKSAERQGEQPFSYYERLLALTKSLKLTDNVHFTGFRSDIPRIMASVDVVVHSSSEPEPASMVVIEGMFAGRPVIATNGGGMSEMIDDGVTGLLVPLKDPQAMAQAILLYYQDRALAKRIAIAGQQKAEEQFRAQRYVGEVRALYQTLLA